MLEIPAVYLDILWKILSTILVGVAVVVINRVLDRFLKSRVKESSHFHTLRMLTRNSIFIIGAVIVLAVWLGFGSSFTVAMGILGAGIAFASQEVIGSLAGYLNIVTSNLYQIGDRVRIGNVIGDVLDITLLRTTVMEIGEWVKADQYTGRLVTVANRMIFSDPVFNYTQHWNYLWDEITIPITYESDWERAVEILLKHGDEYSTELRERARTELREMKQHYPALHEASIEPGIFSRMTDNWIELTLRYIVDARQRREVQGELHRELLEHFAEEPNITVASMTVEIVGFPPVNVDRDS